MQHRPDAREDVYFVLTSLAHVVIAVLFGVLLNPTQFPALLVLSFAVSSKLFALFAGENERFFAHLRWVAWPLAALSLIILSQLPATDIVLGLILMLLYLNYPRLIKARERSPLDILFHGTRYAILFWLGYSGALSVAGAAGATVVFLFGVSGELLVGLRSDGRWRTTASILGTASTVRVVNLLSFLLIVMASLLFSQEVDFPLIVAGVSVPIPLIVGVVLALFIMWPVRRTRSRLAPLSVRRREIVAIALVAMIIVGFPAAFRVDLSRTASQPDYTVTVGMQTIVAGPNPWSVQWIVFNLQNSRNYYYVLLHTDGTLELGREVNGTREAHLDEASTGLSPFAWHLFQITVSDGQVTIYIDGKAYISASIVGAAGTVMISQSFPKTNLWVVRVTEFEVSSPG